MHVEASIDGRPYFIRSVSRKVNTINVFSSLKMDKWKHKELRRMELGGNKRA